jgi:hypothetical protein
VSDALRLLAALALPWLAGAMVVRAALSRTRDGNPWVEAGYGHFAGIVLLTVLMQVTGRVGPGLSVPVIGGALLAIAFGGWWLCRRWAMPEGDEKPSRIAMPTVLKAAVTCMILLLLLRAGTLASEVLVRPLFPWDAWSQWATKAKVWSALRELVPFIGYDAWLARAPGYTDTAPHYPATIPLLQTWMALALGRWDDTLINLPWLAAYVALGLALFGQLARLGASTGVSIVATYLVLSLPLLDVHVALAGYADLHLAAAYALAVLALAEWESTRSRSSLVLLAVSAVLLPLLKVPGIAWLGTIVLGAALATWGTSRARVVALVAIVLAITVAAALVLGPGKVSVASSADQQQIVQSLALHLFAFGSWNLLWYLVPIALAMAWRELIRRRATTLTLASGFGFLAWTFLFTQAGDWVVDYTTVNRALLHIAPAVTAFAVLVVSDALHRRETRTGTVAASSPGVPLAAGEPPRPSALG